VAEMPGAIGPPRGCDDSNLGNAVLAIDLVGLNIDVIVTYATGVTESCTSKSRGRVSRRKYPMLEEWKEPSTRRAPHWTNLLGMNQRLVWQVSQLLMTQNNIQSQA
jgi:hypothetical protein